MAFRGRIVSCWDADMSIREWFGRECVATLDGETREVLVFDWTKLSERSTFLNDIFGDCEVPGDYARWLGGKRDQVEWKGPEVPFALVAVSGVFAPGEWSFPSGAEIPPELVAIWVTDPSSDGPVYAIELSGSAVPQAEAEKITERASTIEFVQRA